MLQRPSSRCTRLAARCNPTRATARMGNRLWSIAGDRVEAAVDSQRMAGEDSTPASDIYATGVLLYRMLAGRFPFSGDHSAAIAAQHQQQPPQPPSDLRPDIPAWLDAVVLRALAKQPAERFPSAGAMRAALLDGTPAETNQPTRPVAATTPAPDTATRVVQAAVPAPSSGLTRTRGNAPARGRPGWPAALVALVALVVIALLVAAVSDGGGPAEGDAGSEIASVPTATAIVPPTEAAAAMTIEPTQSAEQAVPLEPTPTSEPAPEETAPVPDDAAGDPQSHLDTLRSLVGDAATSAAGSPTHSATCCAALTTSPSVLPAKSRRISRTRSTTFGRR